METIKVLQFDDWRSKARDLLANQVDPQRIGFMQDDGQSSLFEIQGKFWQSLRPDPAQESYRVPPAFLQIAETVACHRDPNRWNLLYRLLWRITNGEPNLLKIVTDDDVLSLNGMEKQVRRDSHKMKAFVRFRKVVRNGEEYFVAWHKPDHRIVRRIAPFFARRFKAMNWTILTPDESVVWDQQKLIYGKGVPRSDAPDSDELEELWKTYYASIFNPARIKLKMMKSEMPVRHWSTLPEAQLIDELIASAPARVDEMIERHEGFTSTAAQHIQANVKPPETLAELKILADSCTACELYHDATQVVFGVGNPDASLVLVGEQPGDQEDIAGQPFVGPAGQLLDDILAQAGIERRQIYLTNVVKHFKHTVTQSTRGKRRLHQRPGAREIRCCRPWLAFELEMVRPEVLVCLGSTAAQAIINPGFSVNKQRGQAVPTSFCPITIATFHPSAALRNPDPERSDWILQSMIEDLKLACKYSQRQ